MEGLTPFDYCTLIVPGKRERFQESFLNFFAARLRNDNTCAAYVHNLRRLLDWMERHGLAIDRLTPAHIGVYMRDLPGSAATRQQHLAAIRKFFSHLSLDGLIAANPALAVEGPRLRRPEGKTPAFDREDLRRLLDSIERDTLVGLRDRALISTMFFTFGRVSAVIGLDLADFVRMPRRSVLRLKEKMGLEHELPCHRDLEEVLLDYIETAKIHGKDTPLFQSVRGRSQTLLGTRVSRSDIYKMIRRRTERIGLPPLYGCHSFRATGITVFLDNGGTLEKAQKIAGHASPETTKLYDRRVQRDLREEIQRMRI